MGYIQVTSIVRVLFLSYNINIHDLHSQPTKNQEYLPPFDPRNPNVPNPDYGTPDDVSVQGLPTQEQQPIFQTSPINGQQYQGPAFNADIKNLDQSLRQVQV